MVKTFFEAIGLEEKVPKLRKLSRLTKISYEKLVYYNEAHILPDKNELDILEKELDISRDVICLRMGIISNAMKIWLAENAENLISNKPKNIIKKKRIKANFRTKSGRLYNCDCLKILPSLPDSSVDVVFADPPFNLKKNYGQHISDDMSSLEYEQWCYKWLDECIRTLKPGGSLFIWHIPKWNQKLGSYLSQFLEFRHSISVKMNYGMPISGKLYPSHYSLLYLSKGKRPSVFQPDRVQIDTCRKCGHELKDYGGHKDKLNPHGLNMQDVWLDINPVKHNKKRAANELPLSLLDRIIEMSSKPGDVIMDPFGGTGVTYIVSELKQRKWIGCESGDIQVIRNRFKNKQNEKEELKKYRDNVNKLFSKPVKKLREENKFWINATSKKKAI